MDVTSVGWACLALGVAWLAPAAALWRAGRRRVGVLCALVAAAHLVAAWWPQTAPLVLLAWSWYGLAVPSGSLLTPQRRVTLALVALGLLSWTGRLIVDNGVPEPAVLVEVGLAVAAVTAVGAAARCLRATTAERRDLQWLAAGAVLAAATAVVLLALHLLTGVPERLSFWLVVPLALVPLAQAAAAIVREVRAAQVVLVEAFVVSGLAGLVVAVYLVVVVGLGRAPVGAERDVLLSSLAASIVVATLALPARQRLVALGRSLVGRQETSAEEAVTTFGARMTRAVPMDELMLQLAESLRATIATAGAEVWVGTDGVLSRSVSVPSRPVERLELGEHERIVVGRARIGGPSWTSVWLPQLLGPAPAASAADREGPRRSGSADRSGDVRVAPAAHLGELLGLLVVRRRPEEPLFTEDDERLLVDLARQLGLALHNVRLDSALQESLEELERRNLELQASRLRIVTASDESRRAIERNLHDGAQQHLVALAVKLGLARSIAEEEPDAVPELLEELRADVRTTITELRELAHGIYPPLLRDSGLGEALRTASARSPLPCLVDVDLPGRYAPEVETAAYFCCLEAIQNAGKHAGEGATVTVRVGRDGATLWFTVQDDGRGFDGDAVRGHGFVNMGDRLGALGGELAVTSSGGRGTSVTGRIPADPLVAASQACASTPAAPAVVDAPAGPGSGARQAAENGTTGAAADATAPRDEIVTP